LPSAFRRPPAFRRCRVDPRVPRRPQGAAHCDTNQKPDGVVVALCRLLPPGQSASIEVVVASLLTTPFPLAVLFARIGAKSVPHVPLSVCVRVLVLTPLEIIGCPAFPPARLYICGWLCSPAGWWWVFLLWCSRLCIHMRLFS